MSPGHSRIRVLLLQKRLILSCYERSLGLLTLGTGVTDQTRTLNFENLPQDAAYSRWVCGAAAVFERGVSAALLRGPGPSA
jgi:hypothetical protein